MFRAGAFKPRTSPYSFQGLGKEGLVTLRRVREEVGLPVVSEVMDTESAPAMAEVVDVLQVGARSMQNFSLLKKLGELRKPVLLKRGLAATLDEWLMAAEYLLARGNHQVVLCERGVRTFNNHSRNTLDLNVVPLVRKVSHLPVLVDPSHGVGSRDRVRPLARAALAAGAHGLLIEVHVAPETSYSDAEQTIDVPTFVGIVRDCEVLRRLEPLFGDAGPQPSRSATGPRQMSAARTEAAREALAASARAPVPAAAVGAVHLVPLDADHPGFRDPAYRRRRDAIARLALEYREGDPPPVVDYSDEEHRVWRTVWEHVAPLHARYACRTWCEGAAELDLDRRRVPQLVEVNARLEKARLGEMKMLPAAGLVSSRDFLSALGRGVFLSTQYVRHHSRPLYTPEPDVVHELIGHATSFGRPEVVRLSRLFGEVALQADEATITLLERVYWYTLEFGLVREEGQVKVCGAGLLSSYGELGQFESHATLKPFDLTEIERTPYDPTSYQKVLFVGPSFAETVRALEEWLARLGGKSPDRR
jgi:3-deoxy-7-phosphoheptulonate synthase